MRRIILALALILLLPGVGEVGWRARLQNPPPPPIPPLPEAQQKAVPAPPAIPGTFKCPALWQNYTTGGDGTVTRTLDNVVVTEARAGDWHCYQQWLAGQKNQPAAAAATQAPAAAPRLLPGMPTTVPELSTTPKPPTVTKPNAPLPPKPSLDKALTPDPPK